MILTESGNNLMQTNNLEYQHVPNHCLSSNDAIQKFNNRAAMISILLLRLSRQIRYNNSADAAASAM